MVAGEDRNRLQRLFLPLPGSLEPFPKSGADQEGEGTGHDDDEGHENPSGIPARAGYGSSHEEKTFEMANGAWVAVCLRSANDGGKLGPWQSPSQG